MNQQIVEMPIEAKALSSKPATKNKMSESILMCSTVGVDTSLNAFEGSQ